jgi:hypothetical protein
VIAEEMGIAHIAAQRVHAPTYGGSIILKIEAPRPAADVRKPDRSECPAKSFGSSPTRRALALNDPDHGDIGQAAGAGMLASGMSSLHGITRNPWNLGWPRRHSR